MRLKIEKDLPLLEALQLLAPESSKNTLRSWVEKGRVFVGGRLVRSAKEQVRSGEEVSVGKRTQFAEEGMEILFEDEHIVVINKPEGLLSVATDFQKWMTAHSILKRRFHNKRVYPVHRLDRETSGVMLFTYTERAREAFKELFFHHQIDREYYAVVEGIIPEDKGTWKSYLHEDEAYNVRSVSDPSRGLLAITHFEVLKRNKTTTALRLQLETGRKNQIRAHCKEAGFPVVGDEKYGATTNLAGRLCLHARKLGFIHPITKKALNFESPVPQSLSGFFPK